MKIPTKFFFRLLMLAIPLSSLTQELPNVIPPSPEATSLGKFTEVPISHYTGLANISIPITSYEVGGKSFPVSLSYHARGIRVEEIASRVGIGWALNAGGQISRQTRHHPDDKSPNGYLNPGVAYSGNILIKSLADGTWYTSQTTRDSYLTLTSNVYEDVDRIPDIFNIQAPSVSGKFIFNYNDEKPVLQSYSDIVVEEYYSQGILSRFEVIDQQGFKYYFGVSKDGTRSAQNWEQNIGNYAFPYSGGYTLTSNQNFFKTYNTWMLMDIESPNGELVSFEYELETSEFYRRSYDGIVPGSPPLNMDMPTNYSSNYQSYQYQLKKIIHDGGEIVFQESTINDREDLNGSYALDKIKIYDNNLDLIKSYRLNNNYRSAVNDNNQLFTLKAFEPESSKHLFLDSVEELGKDNTAKPAHVFTYNSQPLPNRFSNSQDFWGYYNGAPNGSFLKFLDDSYGSVDRTVDTLKSMAGMLEKITYPTGGSTKFIYEHNKGVLPSTYSNVVKPKINPVEDFNEGLSHLGSAWYQNGKYSKPVIIDQSIQGKLKVTVTLPSPQDGYCGSPVNQNCNYYIKLQSSTTSYTLYSGVQEFYITPGNYELIFDPKDPNWNPIITVDNGLIFTNSFTITLNWEEQPVNENVHLYTSGKRIKRIEFYDFNNILKSYKEYDYKNFNGSLSSGVVLGLPAFHSIDQSVLFGGITVFEPHGAVPGSPFTTYQGNTIGYRNVTEYFGDKTNNIGKTEYEFSLWEDTGDYVSYPYHPPTDNQWLSGLPLTITNFKKNVDNSYTKVKKRENNYKYGDYNLPLIFTPQSDRKLVTENHSNPGTDLSSEGLLYDKDRKFFRLPLIHVYAANIYDSYYKIYHFTGGVLNNVQSIETLYDDNENPTLVTETETEYDYAQHYQPAKVTSVGSDGIPTVQDFTYPQDATGPIQPFLGTSYSTSPITALSQQNRFIPLEVETFKDTDEDGVADSNEMSNIIKTTYAWDGSVLEPSLIQSSKGTNALQDRIEFKKYDSYGNILQVSKADGMDICYIYGYNNTLPVAKIENASYSQVSSQVANIHSKSNLDDDTCLDSGSCAEKNLRLALRDLRNSLPNSLVTSYTYDPLVGITSMTDPKGYTIYYEYDNFYRLVRVKDGAGKIMSENTYHYKQ